MMVLPIIDDYDNDDDILCILLLEKHRSVIFYWRKTNKSMSINFVCTLRDTYTKTNK